MDAKTFIESLWQEYHESSMIIHVGCFNEFIRGTLIVSEDSYFASKIHSAQLNLMKSLLILMNGPLSSYSFCPISANE